MCDKKQKKAQGTGWPFGNDKELTRIHAVKPT
jgi:hypothetical protein